MFSDIMSGSFMAIAWFLAYGLLGIHVSDSYFNLRVTIVEILRERGKSDAIINVFRKVIHGAYLIIGAVLTTVITAILEATLSTFLSVAAGASFLVSLAILLVITIVTTC